MPDQRAIKQILNFDHSSLRHLLDYARRIEELNTRFLRILPQSLSEHCNVVNLRQQHLVVTADSPAWGAKLRMLTPMLTAQLGEEIQGITIRIAPPHRHAAEPHTPRRTIMSAQTATLIQEYAQSVSDPDLRRALRRLARHA